MPNDLVTVASYWDGNEAQVAKLKLESFGIRAFLANEALVGMAWYYGNAVGGIRLEVAAPDAIRARELLATNVEFEDPEERADFVDDTEELPPNAREANADRALRGALVGMLLVPWQLYVVWLLIKVFVSDAELRRRHRRNAKVAALISFGCLAFYYLFFRSVAIYGA